MRRGGIPYEGAEFFIIILKIVRPDGWAGLELTNECWRNDELTGTKRQVGGHARDSKRQNVLEHGQ